MEQVTTLRLAIDSRDAVKAQKDLDNLAISSGRAEKGAGAMSASFLTLNKVLTVGAAVGIAAQFIKLSDVMTGVESKLKLVTSSTQELTAAQSELFKIAQATRQGYAETVDVYANFSVAMGEMGKSQKEILRVTETVNKAIAISGGTAQQAAAATMQLGQAFASGTLRGDELNSILENSKGLAQAIADGMGVPIGQLRKLGAEGKITSEVLAKALEKSAQSVDEKFGKVGVTVAQSMTVAQNSLLALVGELDKGTQATSTLASGIIDLSKALDENKDDFVLYAQFATASFDRMIDGFNLLYETAELGIHGIMEAPSLMAGKVISTIYEAIADLQIETNKIGGTLGIGKLFSDKEIQGTLLSANQALDKATVATANLKKETKEWSKAYNEFAPSVEDRVLGMIKTSSSVTGSVGGKTTKATVAGVSDSEKEAKDAAEIQAYWDNQTAAAKLKHISDITVASQQSIEDIENAQMQADMDNAIRKQALLDKFTEQTKIETEKINEANLAIWEATDGLFPEDQMQGFFQQWQESIDGVKGGYSDVMSEIDALRPASKDWTAGLTGQAKAVANILNATLDLTSANKKLAKEREKINSSKELSAAQKSVALDELKTVEIENQYAAYSNLAGAMASAFEQGSEGAIAFTALQSALGIASSWTAIAEAWALGFPQNIPAVAAVTAAVMPIISQLGGSTGGGGGYSQPQSITDVQAKQENYQSDTEAIISRLDRSNELLEIIGKTGSAAQVDVLSKKIAYDRTLGDISYSVAQDVVLAEKTEEWRREAVAKLIEGASKATGVSLGVYTGIIGKRIGSAYLDTTALAGNIEASVKYINYLSENIDNINFEGIDRFERSDVTGWVDDILEAVSEFSTGLIDNINALKDASIDFQDTFDSLTGTATYSTQRLQKAYGEVNALVGDSTLPEYLARQIENIEKLYLSQSDIQTLLIQDTSALIDQEAILTRISGELGVAFEGGAKDALDYLESINLVAEAMVASRENIESFIGSLRTSEENAMQLASSLGVELATSVQGLSELFFKLSNDIEGLSDADLELLNANKDLLVSYAEEASAKTEVKDATNDAKDATNDLNTLLSETSSSISRMESAFNTIKSILDKIRGSAKDSSYNLNRFYESLGIAKNSKGNAEEFQKALGDVSSFSSALMDSAYFGSSEEMAFAQSVSANELEALGEYSVDQIDYLRMIEENTRAQVALLSSQISDLSSSVDISSQISRELLQAIAAGETSQSNVYAIASTEQWTTTATEHAMEWVRQTRANLPAFNTGGYTGDYSTSTVAGIVHGQEYVVNAKTTRDLGLNNSSGVFNDMLKEMSMMRGELNQLRSMAVTQTATQVKTLSTQRAILDSVSA